MSELTIDQRERYFLKIAEENVSLKSELENCHQQDRLKTKEINVLVKENRELKAELSALRELQHYRNFWNECVKAAPTASSEYSAGPSLATLVAKYRKKFGAL